MPDCLVLDTAGYPIGFLDWQDAVTCVYKGNAYVVAEDPNRKLHSQRQTINCPVVIQVVGYISRKLKIKVPFTKKTLAIRDYYSCQYCGRGLEPPEYTRDHVVPESRGGDSGWRNIVLACKHCNKSKDNRTPEEARMHLRQKPYEPTQFDPRFNFKLHVHKMRPEWKDYEPYLLVI